MSLKHLHSLQIVHRDLKPENIFLDKDGNAKTGDFGLALKMASQSQVYAAATKYYQPPEAHSFKKMTEASDIWALGVIVVEMITDVHPFEGRTLDETVANIINGRFKPLPDYIQGELKTMILRMMAVDPVQRPTTNELLNSDFMQILALIDIEKEEFERFNLIQQLKWLLFPIVTIQQFGENLKIPFEGTEQQKKEIIKNQQNNFELITQNIKGKKYNDVQFKIIQANIIDGLIFIFENRELKSISRTYSSAFSLIVDTASQEVKLLIYNKKPYPGLIRLLQHSNDLIINEAINSIFLLINAGSTSTPELDPHPHYETIQESDGINKIFDLFQKNGSKYSKDRAALCLSFLFRMREITDSIMRMKIINHIKSLLSDSDDYVKEKAQNGLKYLKLNSEQLKKIELRLNQPIEGTEEQQKLIIQKQETDLQFIQSVLQDENNNEFLKLLISSGIIKSPLIIITTRDLKQITRTNSLTVYSITNNVNDEGKLLIYNKNPYPGLIHLLEHSDNLIHGDAIISIFLLIQAGSSTTKESDPHPHYESIQACNGIKKIFALFQKNVSKYSRDRAAFCIGFLFKAREITDPVMRQEIINHLKSLLNDLNDLAKERAKNALKYLAQNAVNRCDILNETELIKIEQDLKLSFEGTEEQKKDILKKQETDLLLIQVILKGRNDDELRKWILSTGIIESLLFIFSNRDLISITQTYSSAFFQLTNNLSDEVKLLIYNKKPYPGLIRLLEHTDNLISGDAIISIFLILWAGANTTKKSDTNPHPHYESIQACDGLKKIIALFQKNVSKYSRDRSAFCIGFLFKAREITDPMMRQEIINHLKSLLNDQNDLAKERAKNALKYLALNAVNRSEIMQNFDLKTMAKNLLKELKVSEQEKQEIIKTQEFDCQLLYSLLFKIEDFQLRIEAINAGIIDALLHIFASRDLDYISKPYVVGFFIFTHPYSIPFSQLLIGKSPFPSLLRLLDHKDEQVVCEILASIDNIIYAGAIGTELTSQHPYYTGLASAGGIEKIYSVFKKTTDQYNIVPSAICLGIVLRAQEIKDSTMRKEIIEQLKSTVDDPDEETRNESRLSLKCLSQNQVNKTDIESNGFIIPE